MTTKTKKWCPITSDDAPPTIADRYTKPVLSEDLADSCPFCGDQPTAEYWHGGPPSKRMVGCQNDECHIAPSAAANTLKEALAIWNQRA